MAQSLNKSMIIGRIGAMDTRFTKGGTPVCNISIATDESYVDNFYAL